MYFDISLTHSITGHFFFEKNDLYFRNSFGEFVDWTIGLALYPAVTHCFCCFVGGLDQEGFVITCAKGSVSQMCMLNIAKFVS